jgi:hypothetical protein
VKKKCLTAKIPILMSMIGPCSTHWKMMAGKLEKLDHLVDLVLDESVVLK